MFPAYGDSPYTFAQREFSRAFKEVNGEIIDKFIFIHLTVTTLPLMKQLLYVVPQRQVQIWPVLLLFR